MAGWFWVTLAGLLADIYGAWTLARGLILTEKEAEELSVMSVVGETLEENRVLPQFKDRMAQSAWTKRAVVFLIAGFSFKRWVAD